jgi:hypothetical protein
MRRVVAGVVGLLLLGPSDLRAQAQAPAPANQDDDFKLHFSAELKANGRWSQDDRFPLAFPFPPDFVPVGQPDVAMQTVAPGASLEVSKAQLQLDAELPRTITARVRVAFIDLYNRNPTSTDQTVNVEEAWVEFGRKRAWLEPFEGSSLYLLVGKAPRFERQPFRRLESYGLVSTALNRFNDLMAQLGGSLGSHFYVFGQISVGNPVFMRDPNAIAGDNGTNPPPNPDPKLHSGFPILYHAEVEELSYDGRFEHGGGAGARFLSADRRRGLDVLGYYYRRRLAENARLRGTFYKGDLRLIDGTGTQGIGLPITTDFREHYGASADLRLGDLSGFAQVAHEEIAGLPRTGFEVEAGYKIQLGDLADPSALFPLIQPAIRWSRVDDDFSAPPSFVAPSFAWDWSKLDVGVRVTVIKRVDLTLEYAFHDVKAKRPIKHDEALATLRVVF